MSKHTPGPWRYELDGHESNDMRHAVLSEANDLWVAATYRSGTTAKQDTSPEADAEAEANARLIAAAPDLLEALTLLVRYFPTDTDMREVGCGDAHVNAACSAYDVARAVITKATGEQS